MTDARAFRGFRFPAEVILWAVRWYLQFPISYRELERMLADRGEDGNAQAANAFLSPLTDAESRAFLAIFDKLGDTPNWLAAARDGEAEAFEAAYDWVAGERGQARLRATGAPAKWMRLAKAKRIGGPVGSAAPTRSRRAPQRNGTAGWQAWRAPVGFRALAHHPARRQSPVPGMTSD